LDSSASAAPSRSTAYESPGGGYTPSSSSSGENLRKTVSENQFFGTDFSRDGGNGYHADGNSSQRETVFNGATTECPNCHYQVRSGANTCPNCGYPISAGGAQPKAKACPKCGAQNSEEAKFCNSCGAPMDSAQQGNGKQQQNHTGTVNPWIHQNNNGAFCTLKPVSWEVENINHEAIAFSGSVITLNRANTDPNNQSITSKEQAELSYENGEWYIIDKSAMHTTYVLASRKMKINKGDTIILGNRLFEFN
jgi:RNA polymerase subunit RPABC4/transcription elongation factor Spt4